MSVWRRLQRIGKKAAKFQFTVCFQELSVECHSQYKPGTFVVVWSRRSRRYTTKPVECKPSSENMNAYTHVWAMPENMEFTTTLYRNEKALLYEEKEWICQLEDIGRGGASSRLPGPSVRRRVLATRQVEMSEFASAIPTQTSLKINMRLASKKLTAATLLVTLHSMVVKEGDATDEDMISLASLMSLSRAGSFSIGSGLTINDVGGLRACSPSLFRSVSTQRTPIDNIPPKASSNDNSSFHTDLSELTARLQALERVSDRDESTTDSDAAGQRPNDVDKHIILNVVSKAGDTASSVAFHSTPSLSEPGILNSPDTTANSGLNAMSTASGRDLFTWCQEVMRNYPSVRVTDLTTSFQSGLAFCAILHHFFPNKIDFHHLASNTPIENCRLAFEVASKIGVPRVLDPAEVASPSKPPDLLSMLTYLHQLRTICVGSKSKDAVADKEADSNEKPSHKKTVISLTQSPLPVLTHHTPSAVHPDTCNSGLRSITFSVLEPQNPPSPSKRKSLSSLQTEHMLVKARLLLQQTKQQQHVPLPYTDALPPLANCRKPRPLSSASLGASCSTDIDGLLKYNNVKDSCDSAKRHPLRHSSTSDLHPLRSLWERRKRQRPLMRFNSDGTIFVPNGAPATPKNGSLSLPHWIGPSSPSRLAPNDNLKIRRLKLSQLNLFASGRGTTAPVPIRIGNHHFDSNAFPDDSQSGTFEASDHSSPYSYAMPDSKHNVRDSAYFADSSLSNYLRNEQAELDRAQQELDQEAATLEKRLRIQMARAPGSAAEEQLLNRWFVLVNKKSALIHRAHQLSIMEKEDDLKRKTEMLQDEVRRIMSIEDSLKSDSDRRREELLLEDLVNIINERNDMINELDIHEQALAEEMRLEGCTTTVAEFSHRGRSEKCVVQ